MKFKGFNLWIIFLIVSCDSSKEIDDRDKLQTIVGQFGGTYIQYTSNNLSNDCLANGIHQATVLVNDRFMEIAITTVNGDKIEGNIFPYKELEYNSSSKIWSASFFDADDAHKDFSFNEMTKELSYSVNWPSFRNWSFEGVKDMGIDANYVATSIVNEISGSFSGNFRSRYETNPYSEWQELETTVSLDSKNNIKVHFNSSEIVFKYIYLVSQADGFKTKETCPSIRNFLSYDISSGKLTIKYILGLYEGDGFTYYFDLTKN